MVSCGRDNAVSLWSVNGSKVRDLDPFCQLPLRAVLADAGQHVFATDFSGRVAVWNAKDGKRIGELDIDPPPIDGRQASARKQLARLTVSAVDSPSRAALEAVIAQLESAKVLSEIYSLRATLTDKQREAESAARAIESCRAKIHEAKTALARSQSPAPDLAQALRDARAEAGRNVAMAHRAAAEISAARSRVDELLKKVRDQAGKG